jgi:hypothetical protein
MTNPSVALQTAYYEALTSPPLSVSGAVWQLLTDQFGISEVVFSEGDVVGVFSDIVPDSEILSAYVVLGQQTFVDDADKTVFGAEATQNVTVVTSFQSDAGGKRLSSLIANEVMKRIRVRQRLPMIGYNMITATLDSYLTLTEQTSTTTLIRAEIRFRHIIEELDLVYLTDENGLFLTDNNGNYLTE